MFSSWRRRTVPSSMCSQPTPHSAARQLLPAPRRAALYREAAAPRRRRAHDGPRGSLRGTRTAAEPPGDSSAELSDGSQPAACRLPACLLASPLAGSLVTAAPQGLLSRLRGGGQREGGPHGAAWRAAGLCHPRHPALSGVRQRAAGPCAGGCASPPCFQTVLWSAGTRAF